MTVTTPEVSKLRTERPTKRVECADNGADTRDCGLSLLAGNPGTEPERLAEMCPRVFDDQDSPHDATSPVGPVELRPGPPALGGYDCAYELPLGRSPARLTWSGLVPGETVEVRI